MNIYITEDYIMRLAKSAVIRSFANSEPDKKDYWKQVFTELTHTKIQIVKGE